MTSVRMMLLLCVIIWGWTFIAMKICLQFFHPIDVIALRFAIGLPLLYAIVRVKQIPLTFSRNDLPAIGAGSAIIVLHFTLQAYALTHTSATKTGWIIGVSPLAIALLSFLFLRERIGKWEISGIVVATGGIFLLIYNGSMGNFGWLQSEGDWIILVSAFTWACYTIVSRNLSRARNPLSVTLVMFTPVTILCLAVMMVSRGVPAFSTIPASSIWAIVFLGVPGMLAQWVWQEGVARLGAAKAGVFLYLEPVATMALAVPLLGEHFTGYIFGGGLLVLGGVWMAEQRKAAV